MEARLMVPLVLVSLVACREEAPEAQIQKAFDACVKAVEEADPGSAVEILSPQFSGPEGMSREEAKLYLVGLLRQEKVGITVFSSRIQVKGSKAQQAVEVLLTSRTGSALLPEDASRRIFLLGWEKADGRWLLKGLQESRSS